MNTSAEDREARRRLLAEEPASEWFAEEGEVYTFTLELIQDRWDYGEPEVICEALARAPLIAAARNALPALLTDVEESERRISGKDATIRQLRAALRDIRSQAIGEHDAIAVMARQALAATDADEDSHWHQ